MKTFEKVGQITVEHNGSEKQSYKGAEYFRALVEWMNNRNEQLNQGKSTLELMREFNKFKD
jgi:hypothetical protein